MEKSPASPIDIIKCEEALTIPGLLFERAVRDPNRTGFVEFQGGRWTVEDGALTPTLKVRRQVIAARFKSEVDELFQEMAVRKKNAGGAPLGVGGIEHQNRSKRTRQNLSGQK